MGAPVHASDTPVHPVINTLRALRVAHDVTQDDLAGQLAISRSTLLSWERGTRVPTLAALTAWCTNLGVTLVITPTARAPISPATIALLRASIDVTLDNAQGIGCALPLTPEQYRERADDLQRLLAIAESPNADEHAGRYAPRDPQRGAGDVSHFSRGYGGPNPNHPGDQADCPFEECQIARRLHAAAADIQDLTYEILGAPHPTGNTEP